MAGKVLFTEHEPLEDDNGTVYQGFGDDLVIFPDMKQPKTGGDTATKQLLSGHEDGPDIE